VLSQLIPGLLPHLQALHTGLLSVRKKSYTETSSIPSSKDITTQACTEFCKAVYGYDKDPNLTETKLTETKRLLNDPMNPASSY
jgi:hypothetical protein